MKTLQPEDVVLPVCLADDENERAFLRSFLKPGMVFWDIGACYGLYTGPASKLVGLSGSVLAFEPNPSAVSLLVQTVELNQLTNVQIQQVAISNFTGVADFHTSKRVNHGSLGLPHEQQDETIGIWVVTLDSLVKFGHPIPNLIKIDANGSEPLVLEGGKALWESNSPPTIICKFNKQHPTLPPSEDCFKRLPKYYKWHKINKDGSLSESLSPYPILAPNPGGKGHRNLVSVPC